MIENEDEQYPSPTSKLLRLLVVSTGPKKVAYMYATFTTVMPQFLPEPPRQHFLEQLP